MGRLTPMCCKPAMSDNVYNSSYISRVDMAKKGGLLLLQTCAVS